jgi:hypothetical protein
VLGIMLVRVSVGIAAESVEDHRSHPTMAWSVRSAYLYGCDNGGYYMPRRCSTAANLLVTPFLTYRMEFNQISNPITGESSCQTFDSCNSDQHCAA